MFGVKTNALFVVAVLAVASVAMGQSAGSIVVTPVSATTSEALEYGGEVLDGSLTIDNSGLSAELDTGDPASSVAGVTHNGYDGRTSDFQGWNTLADGTSGVGASITLDLGAVMDDIEGFWVWNGISVGNRGRAVASVNAEVSSDGTNFTSVGTYSLADVVPADDSPAEFISFSELQDSVQAVKLTIASLHDSHDSNPLDYAGMREIRISQVPEPLTMSLLAVGGLALLRRKRA